jgi:hypothetical protein
MARRRGNLGDEELSVPGLTSERRHEAARLGVEHKGGEALGLLRLEPLGMHPHGLVGVEPHGEEQPARVHDPARVLAHPGEGVAHLARVHQVGNGRLEVPQLRLEQVDLSSHVAATGELAPDAGKARNKAARPGAQLPAERGRLRREGADRPGHLLSAAGGRGPPAGVPAGSPRPCHRAGGIPAPRAARCWPSRVRGDRSGSRTRTERGAQGAAR